MNSSLTLNQGSVMSSFEKPNKEEIKKINSILGRSSYILRGKTYQHRDYLKSRGWYWDKISNGWRLDNAREDDARLREVKVLKKCFLGKP